MAANPSRSQTTNKLYRYQANRHLCDWLSRPLDAITRRDVEARFNRITADHGWSQANQAMSLLRSVYRRPCVDLDGLRNPVDLWLAAGGKFHRKLRRKISTPAEVLPCWRAGIEAEASNPVMRDALWFGLYTGMRLREVLTLRWERVDMSALTFQVEETKTGVPLELPITRQLASILERRQAESESLPARTRDWVFPSPAGTSGHVEDPHYLYPRITKTGGAKFWFHALRNCFITVAERDLMLPSTLTKRLVNHARPNDVTEGYAADWTVAQLREPAQRIADRIETLMRDVAAPWSLYWYGCGAALIQIVALYLAVRRLRPRGRAGRCHVHAHRHRETQRHRSASLARRCPRPYRRPAADPSARASPLALEGRPATGLGRVTFNLWRPANSRQPPRRPAADHQNHGECNPREVRPSPEAYAREGLIKLRVP